MNGKLDKFFSTAAVLLISLSALEPVHAAMPKTTNYQGYLTNTAGTPINGPVSMTFRLYAVVAGGAALWTETQTINVGNGIYSAILGSVNPLELTYSAQLWIGIQISPDAEMTPRQPLTSVPYALRADWAQDAGFNYAGAYSKGGPAALALALSYDGNDCPAGEYARGVDASGNAQGCTAATGGGGGNWTVSGSNMSSGVSGYVGIGTATPSRKLDVSDTSDGNWDPAIYGEHDVPDYGVGVSGKGGYIGVQGSVSSTGSSVFGYTGVSGAAHTTSGVGFTYGGYFSAYGGAHNYAIYASGDKSYLGGNVGIGTEFPSQKLDVYGDYLTVYGNNNQAYLGGDNGGMEVEIGSLNAAVTKVAVFNHTSHKYMDTYVGTLHVMGGADFSEPFNFSGKATVKPGMLMAIDPDHPGELRIADKAYDKTVAGIVSGANGVQPGLMMHQEGTAADGTTPIALSGRVYAWADASLDPIVPGDLLTTSGTPGHAMKVVDHTKALGAIIGKSMSALPSGTGMILVLVSLQ